MRDLPVSFDELMTLCIKVDERLGARRATRNYNPHEATGHLGAASSGEHRPSRALEGAGGEEPMQVGSSHLSAAERQRRISAGECLYCGRKGHIAAICPSKVKGHARQ